MRDVVAILEPLQLRAGSLRTVWLKIAVLPFIIDEMAVDCVGEGSIPGTASVILFVEDPQEA